MERFSITSEFFVYPSAAALPEAVKHLMQEAEAIRKLSYAPYSRFHVGAAILLDNGKVVLGSNQENAAYPSGLCAERVAIFQAGAVYPQATIKMIAINAAAEDQVVDTPIPPCGACRQSIAEYEEKQAEPIAIYFMGETGKVYQSPSLKNLLPLIFDREVL